MIDERSHHPPIDPLSHSRHGDSSGPLRKVSCVRTWLKINPGASAPGSSDSFRWTAFLAQYRLPCNGGPYPWRGNQ